MRRAADAGFVALAVFLGVPYGAGADDSKEPPTHWAFRPIRKTAPPQMREVSNPIDQFLLAPIVKRGFRSWVPAPYGTPRFP